MRNLLILLILLAGMSLTTPARSADNPGSYAILQISGNPLLYQAYTSSPDNSTLNDEAYNHLTNFFSNYDRDIAEAVIALMQKRPSIHPAFIQAAADISAQTSTPPNLSLDGIEALKRIDISASKITKAYLAFTKSENQDESRTYARNLLRADGLQYDLDATQAIYEAMISRPQIDPLFIKEFADAIEWAIAERSLSADALYERSLQPPPFVKDTALQKLFQKEYLYLAAQAGSTTALEGVKTETIEFLKQEKERKKGN